MSIECFILTINKKNPRVFIFIDSYYTLKRLQNKNYFQNNTKSKYYTFTFLCNGHNYKEIKNTDKIL